VNWWFVRWAHKENAQAYRLERCQSLQKKFFNDAGIESCELFGVVWGVTDDEVTGYENVLVYTVDVVLTDVVRTQ
jgi:hypothetical protein